jgi:hypothetical protein
MHTYRWFPFLKTSACCEACANLKGAFLVAVVSSIVSWKRPLRAIPVPQIQTRFRCVSSTGVPSPVPDGNPDLRQGGAVQSEREPPDDEGRRRGPD